VREKLCNLCGRWSRWCLCEESDNCSCTPEETRVVRRLEAERDRYRAALERIADKPPRSETLCGVEHHDVDCPSAIARAALKGDE